jgi:hypothetical protein
VGLATAIALLMAGVAPTEAWLGRAWASGFRALAGDECGRRAIAERGLRYAGVLWLANGVALWLAAVTSLASGSGQSSDAARRAVGREREDVDRPGHGQ